MCVSLNVEKQYTNLHSAVESREDDAIQKQDTIQHVTDLRFCESR